MYTILDAYYVMNLPQPIPFCKTAKILQKFYKALGRFLFNPGSLTPSFFNDDVLFRY